MLKIAHQGCFSHRSTGGHDVTLPPATRRLEKAHTDEYVERKQDVIGLAVLRSRIADSATMTLCVGSLTQVDPFVDHTERHGLSLTVTEECG